MYNLTTAAVLHCHQLTFFICNCMANTDMDDIPHFPAHLEQYNFMPRIGF